MATVKTDSLILVVVLRERYTADVSVTLRFVSIGTFLRPARRLRFLRQGLGPAYSHPHRLGVKSAFGQPALLRCFQ